MKKKPIRIIGKVIIFSGLTFLILLLGAYAGAIWFKKDIITYFNTELNKEIKGKAHIADLNFTLFNPFPHVSIILNDISIQDSVYQKDVLFVKKISLQVNLFKLINKQVEIQSVILKDSKLSILNDSTGYSNLSVFKRDSVPSDTSSKSSKSMYWDLRRVVLDNVTLVFVDQPNRKNVHFQFQKVVANVKRDTGTIYCNLTGKVYSEGLIFKDTKGPFLKNKQFDINLLIDYHIASKVADIKPSWVENEGHRYTLDGGIDLLKEPQQLALNIQSKNTDYDKALAILSTHLQKVLNQFHVKGSLDCQVNLLIPLHKKVDPRAHVYFQVKNSNLRMLDVEVEQATLTGMFNNQKDSLRETEDENSIVVIPKAQFMYHGISCEVDGTLSNLTVPHIEASAKANAHMRTLHHFLDSAGYKFKKGTFDVSATYKGPLVDIRETGVKIDGADLLGQINVTDGHMALVGKNMNFSDINFKMDFTEKDVVLPALKFMMNGNPIVLKGKMKDMFPFLLHPDRKTKVDLQLSSSSFDVDKVLIPSQPNHKSSSPTKKEMKWAMTRIDSILSRIEVNFGLNVPNLYWRRTSNASLSGFVTVSKHAVNVHRLIAKFKTGGTIVVNGKYQVRPGNVAKLTMDAKLTSIKAPSLFYAFDNFKQATVTHQNLEGRIDADISFGCELKDLYLPQQKSMYGEIHLVIKNGMLKDFAPFRNLNKLVFKHRDLMAIRFDEINNQFSLQGSELYISKMQVNSSALSLVVEGIYSFKEKTDLSIRIPLSNLKSKHDSTYYHIDDKSGVNILLRAKEKDGKMAVFLDPFDKYHKEN